MPYQWRIKWKDFNEQDLLVRESQGKYLNEQLVLDASIRGDRFTINNIPYRYDAIDKVEPTTKKEEPTVMQIFAGKDNPLEVGPVLDTEGYVVANWYKKEISSQEYEKYYANHPAYFSLGRTDNNNISIAFRRAEEVNGERSPDIELCSEAESNKLWKYYDSH